METRQLGNTGRQVSVIGLGTWQLGTDWGQIDDARANAILDAAYESGVTFFDTADVYGDGRSETLIGDWLRRHPDAKVTVATKMGRRVDQVPQNYVLANFLEWNDRSRANLGVDTLDLVQLHCPPSEVIASAQVFDALDSMVEQGRMRAYGVSVETVEQALEALKHEHLASIQIIVNAFRRKPLRQVLPAAQQLGVAIIARVPLASGLLSGKFSEQTVFEPSDHRSYNREGQAFDIGETFSGVDYATGVQAAREFTDLVWRHGPRNAMPAQVALAWLLQTPGITTVIPGASNPEQARDNAAAERLPALSSQLRTAMEQLYRDRIAAQVEDRW